MYLLDTNTCIGILTNRSPSTVERLRARDSSEICLCSVVRAELLYGARKSERVAENLRLLTEFFAPLVCLPFDDRCADHYGLIRADLEQSGTQTGPNDLLIAAIARAHDRTLVTQSTGEFSCVAGLKVEDWREEA